MRQGFWPTTPPRGDASPYERSDEAGGGGPPGGGPPGPRPRQPRPVDARGGPVLPARPRWRRAAGAADPAGEGAPADRQPGQAGGPRAGDAAGPADPRLRPARTAGPGGDGHRLQGSP